MRQLLAKEPPDTEGRLKVSGREFHHIAEVLRESEGSILHVRLPDGADAPFRIERVDRAKKELWLVYEGGQGGAKADVPPLILFQWALKARAMDLVIRQAAEAGARLIVPVAGKRCVPKVRLGERQERWARIVKEARQQSGSAVSTEVAPAIAIEGVPRALRDAGVGAGSLLLMLDEIGRGGKSLHECVAGKGGDAAALAVGPEGGMSAEEKEALASLGFEGVHFNTNILRAETAALYGIAAVQSAITERAKWRLNA